MMDLLSFLHAEPVEHAHEIVCTEETKQIVLQRKIEFGFSGISLTS